MTTIILLFIAAFAFRYFRELEDETVRKPERTSASDAALTTLQGKGVTVLTN